MLDRQSNIILGEKERLVEEPRLIGLGRLFKSNLFLLIFDPGDWRGADFAWSTRRETNKHAKAVIVLKGLHIVKKLT